MMKKYCLRVFNPGNKRLRVVGEHEYNNWFIEPGQEIDIELSIPRDHKPYVSNIYVHLGEERLYVGSVDVEV